MSDATEGAYRDLLERVRAAQRESSRLGRPVAAWISRPEEDLDPISLFAAGAGGERFFWEDPGAGLRLVALGAAATPEGIGRRRLQDVSARGAALFGELSPLPAALAAELLPLPAALAGPIFVGGFAFSPNASGALWRGFPAVRFVLPEHLLACRDGSSVRTTVLVVEPGERAEKLVAAAETRWLALLDRRGREAPEAPALAPAGVLPRAADDLPAVFRASSDPSPARYRALVREALAGIRAAQFEKVVVARSCTLSRPGGFDPARVLQTLRAAHPACFRFAVGRSEATLVAASPERLVRLEGDRVRSSALAGSAPRGRTPEEDARLGLRLRESKKEQEEHALVVRALRTALEQCCERVSTSESPELLRLDGIQHLHTPIEGVLRRGVPRSLLDLAARLHPSPAVAGAPQEAALSWLRSHEGIDRGWYAGAVGWMTPGGEGELAVALRTVLLRGDDATLHAGAGIVEGSTPESELVETRTKLRAGLAALLEI